MEWVLYDNGLRHERVTDQFTHSRPLFTEIGALNTYMK